jgi:uncharacterized protein
MLLRISILTALTIVLMASHGISVTARPTPQPTQIVETAIRKFERMDLQGFEQLLSPNVRFDNVFSLPNTPATFQGRDAVIANFRELASRFERIEFVDERLYTAQDGQVVIVEARGNFAVRGTGAPYRNRYIFVFEVNNGQITAIREYVNPLTIAETFNIPLPQPSPTR